MDKIISKRSKAIAVRDIIVSGMITQMISVAARLGIADLLKDGPVGSDELAKAAGVQPAALYRLMRGLSSIGIFAEVGEREFELTAMGECLRSDAAGSMRSYAIWGGSECWWRPWGDFMYTLKTGKSAFEKTFGMGIFDYLDSDKEMADIFNTFMNERIVPIAEAVCEAYDFSGVKRIVDVGGGGGLLAATILKANPNLEGVVFDLPKVIESEGHLVEREGVAERCELVGGSFLESVPEGGDVYILSAIVHGFNDEGSIRILKNCRKAMAKASKLLLVESVIETGNEPQFGKLLDLNMMVLPGGKERTEKEFAAILEASGFKLERVIPTRTAMSIVEASI